MLKAINITSINTSGTLGYACEKCGNKSILHLANSIVNVDDEGNIIESVDHYECPSCGKN